MQTGNRPDKPPKRGQTGRLNNPGINQPGPANRPQSTQQTNGPTQQAPANPNQFAPRWACPRINPQTTQPGPIQSPGIIGSIDQPAPYLLACNPIIAPPIARGSIPGLMTNPAQSPRKRAAF
jgi:hypothetical protein